jgi:hypothetical protein
MVKHRRHTSDRAGRCTNLETVGPVSSPRAQRIHLYLVSRTVTCFVLRQLGCEKAMLSAT